MARKAKGAPVSPKRSIELGHRPKDEIDAQLARMAENGCDKDYSEAIEKMPVDSDWNPDQAEAHFIAPTLRARCVAALITSGDLESLKVVAPAESPSHEQLVEQLGAVHSVWLNDKVESARGPRPRTLTRQHPIGISRR